MANKRISELAPIVASELQMQDLLLLSDITANESKKLQLQDLSTFLLAGGNLSGSFYGTASWATFAVNAVNAPLPLSVSYASASTWAFNAVTSSRALSALSASYALSGSFVITASYALTSSIQLIYSSAFCEYAKTASYLLYTPGFMNGTSSFSISSSYAFSSSYARSSSFARSSSHALIADYALNAATGTPGAALSASWASCSYQSTVSTGSLTSSYLYYGGSNNGTASYAMAALSTPGVRTFYGIYKATTQHSNSHSIDLFKVNPTVIGYTPCSVQAMGTFVLPITNSVGINPTSESVNLFILDRWTGVSQSIDWTPAYGYTDTATAGMTEIRIPFSLMGEIYASGSIETYVTASYGIRLDNSRPTQFSISSFSDKVTVFTSAVEVTMFLTYPTSALFQYTSSGVLHVGDAASMFALGADTITELNIPPLGIIQTKYIWNFPLIKFNCSANYPLWDIGGMPPSIQELNCMSCSITGLPPLSNCAVMTTLNCARNKLRVLSDLPDSLTYLNCSQNTTLYGLPDVLPTSLTAIVCDHTLVASIPLSIPNTVISMSFANNSALASWGTSLPLNLQYLDCNHSPLLTSLPTLPSGIKYLWINSCAFTSAAMDNICALLVIGGLSNGILNLTANSSYLPATLTKIATLVSRGWTVTT